ncbi:hypothetical protein COS52_04595, partial [Candidatus Roizmanbacteria bacterium CG03_land_8_20_14_0_80_39_12]
LLTNGTKMSSDPTGHQGKVRVSGIRNMGNGDPFIGNTPIPLVKVSFTMKTDTVLPLEFNWDAAASKTDLPSPDSLITENLSYTGIDTTGSSTPTQIIPTTPPGNPIPISQEGEGAVGTTTNISERKDLLYINSIVTYQAPFRYEQSVKLEKGTYSLAIGARVWEKRGSGMVVALICNETTCGDKKKDEFMFSTPQFPLKTVFSEMKQTITIPDNTDNKQLLLRVFCENGSECEIDYISIEDAWGSERLRNPQFESGGQMSDPRSQPAEWEVDATANMYGSIDPAFGVNGALMINNPVK